MLDFSEKKFEELKAHPENFTVVYDMFGNPIAIHKRSTPPLWVQLCAGAVVIGALLLALWLMDALPF